MITKLSPIVVGCVAVISHDRWFLDRIATHILACEGDSKWTFFDGNYQEYEAEKRKRLGEEGLSLRGFGISRLVGRLYCENLNRYWGANDRSGGNCF